MESAKEEALKVISKLPEQSSWDDIMYELYVLAKIEEGERAIREGRIVSHEEVLKKFLKS